MKKLAIMIPVKLLLFLLASVLYINEIQPAQADLPPSKEKQASNSIQELAKDLLLSERKAIPKENELLTIYDDGFYLKGKDDTIKIGGWYQGDLNLHFRKNTGTTRFRNRRVRLDIRGILENIFEYRLYPQFAGGTANLQEAWLMFKYFTVFRIKVGQYKVPFSLESQLSARWIDFVERSIGVTNLQPAEDLGAMVFGKPFKGIMSYAIGVFNGRRRNLADNNDSFDLAARIVFSPFKSSQVSILDLFFFGGSVTWGNSTESFAGTGYTTAGGSSFATYVAGTSHSDTRIRYAGELQWIYDSFDFKAEYVGACFQNVSLGGTNTNVYINSWYVSLSFLLTGEKRIRNKPVNPKHIFLESGGWGAWEVVARFEQYFINNAPFMAGLITGTIHVDAISGGINWWPNKHLRVMFTYVLSNFEDVITLGGVATKNEHILLARFQYNV